MLNVYEATLIAKYFGASPSASMHVLRAGAVAAQQLARHMSAPTSKAPQGARGPAAAQSGPSWQEPVTDNQLIRSFFCVDIGKQLHESKRA